MATEDNTTSANAWSGLVSTAGQYSFDDTKTSGTPNTTTSGITTSGSPITTSPIGSTSTTTRIMPTGIDAPTMGNLPGLIVPEVDEGKIASLTQKIASPATRALSRTARTALMKHYDNPNVSKMVARETLAGYGESLATALASAGSQARAEEFADRQIETTQAMTEYQAKINRQNTVYAAAWNNYMSQMGSTTSTQYIYPDTGTQKTGYVPEIEGY